MREGQRLDAPDQIFIAKSFSRRRRDAPHFNIEIRKTNLHQFVTRTPDPDGFQRLAGLYGVPVNNSAAKFNSNLSFSTEASTRHIEFVEMEKCKATL